MTDIEELDEETIHTILSLTDIMILHFDRILYTCRGFSIVMATLRKSKAHTSHDFVSELFEEEGELSKIVCKDLFFQIYDPEDVMGFDSFLDELGNKNDVFFIRAIKDLCQLWLVNERQKEVFVRGIAETTPGRLCQVIKSVEDLLSLVNTSSGNLDHRGASTEEVDGIWDTLCTHFRVAWEITRRVFDGITPEGTGEDLEDDKYRDAFADLPCDWVDDPIPYEFRRDFYGTDYDSSDDYIDQFAIEEAREWVEFILDLDTRSNRQHVEHQEGLDVQPITENLEVQPMPTRAARARARR